SPGGALPVGERSEGPWLPGFGESAARGAKPGQSCDFWIDSDYLHAYQFRDGKGRTLIDHGGIWLLELEKFTAQRIENEQQRWLQFFKDGGQLDDTALPDWMTTPEMRQAMSTLRQFSEKERNYHEYQARQNYLRQQRTIQWEMEEERKEKLQALLREQAALKEKDAAMQEKAAAMQEKAAAMQEKAAAMQEKDVAMQEKEAALAEIERLKALLAGKEVNKPD
ncbi:MAG: hypothetical protein AAB316_09455, partial [Bacteroidota bacterium]